MGFSHQRFLLIPAAVCNPSDTKRKLGSSPSELSCSLCVPRMWMYEGFDVGEERTQGGGQGRGGRANAADAFNSQGAHVSHPLDDYRYHYRRRLDRRGECVMFALANGGYQMRD
ncbi:hypothetical protein KR009_011502 [Drosophila setifemur]|nr:hypothetical protein KR009_011502 [Drosophila setifemur]